MSNPLTFSCAIQGKLPSYLTPDNFHSMKAAATEKGSPVVFKDGECKYRVLVKKSADSFFLIPATNIPTDEHDGAEHINLETINYLIRNPAPETSKALKKT
ncbi:hypothetical protein SOPP22_17145 [Shewanella sp. OPT22]|nr:hypothetical protein SOPP22_17145 [Shewanella sp. OPT22]